MPSAGYYLEALRAVYIDACTLVPRKRDGGKENSSGTSFTLQQIPSFRKDASSEHHVILLTVTFHH